MTNKLINWFTLPRLIGLYLIIFCAVGYQKYAIGSFNNYLMFANPFHNLLINKTIYGLHPTLFEDNYKYSPTFAWLMGPFHFLPVPVGVVLWNLLNTVVLVLGIWRYFTDEPDANQKRRVVLAIVFLEALITAQNMQSNNLIVGAVLLGLFYLRRGRVWPAAFFFVLCGFIKFYGMGAAIFFLFYPKKPQFLLAMTAWSVAFALAPWTLIPFDSLMSEYQEWFKVIIVSKLGQLVSVMGIAESWFGMAKTDHNLRIVEAVGATLFLLPFVRFSLWKNWLFQQRMVAYFLLFVIVFNKMAESPTYVLAVVGVALWWVALERKTPLDTALLVLVIVFTSLSPSDIFPATLRNGFFVPYNIKAVPCVLVWLRLQWQLWTMHPTTTLSDKHHIFNHV